MYEWLGVIPKLIERLFSKKEKEQKSNAVNPQGLTQNQDSPHSPSINNSPGATINNYIINNTGVQPDTRAIQNNLDSFTNTLNQILSKEKQKELETPQNWAALSKAYGQAAVGLEHEIQKTIVLGLREKINNDLSTARGLRVKLAQEKLDKLNTNQLSILTLAWLLKRCSIKRLTTKQELLTALERFFNHWKVFLPKELTLDDLDYLDSIGCIEITRGSPVRTKFGSLAEHLLKEYKIFLTKEDLENCIFLKPYEEFWEKFHQINTALNMTGEVIASWFYEARTGEKIPAFSD